MFEYRATVERVVDGDTVDVDIDLGFEVHIKARVRLYGIDTPEVRTRDLEEKERGIAASNRLKELIKERNLILASEKFNSKGKYGRILATLLIETSQGRQNVNEILLEEGHAEIYR